MVVTAKQRGVRYRNRGTRSEGSATGTVAHEPWRSTCRYPHGREGPFLRKYREKIRKTLGRNLGRHWEEASWPRVEIGRGSGAYGSRMPARMAIGTETRRLGRRCSGRTTSTRPPIACGAPPHSAAETDHCRGYLLGDQPPGCCRGRAADISAHIRAAAYHTF